jgi:hypothetical protein
VIAAGGKLGGYGRDLFAKRALLLDEGVIVSGGASEISHKNGGPNQH